MLTFTDLARANVLRVGRCVYAPAPLQPSPYGCRLSPGPTGGEVGRVGFPGPLTAPAARLALSGRLKVLFRGRAGLGVIIEQVATSLDWGIARRGAPSPRSICRPGALRPCVGEAPEPAYEEHEQRKIERAGSTLVCPRTLTQGSAALAFRKPLYG
jgi:hypothetical protein